MNRVLFASASGEHTTPKKFFSVLHKEFHFVLDAAATVKNALCLRFFDKRDNALVQKWGKGSVYINPPYGRGVRAWVDASISAAHQGAVVVMLLPARTDTRWFRTVWAHADEIRFIQGRLRFGGMKAAAPFPSMVVVFRPFFGVHNGSPRVSLWELSPVDMGYEKRRVLSSKASTE